MSPVTAIMTINAPLPRFILLIGPVSIGAIFAEGSSKWRLGWKLWRG
jgi:hypothetical protein